MLKRFEESDVVWAGQPQRLAAALDMDGIARVQLGLDLAIGGEFELDGGGDDVHLDCSAEVQAKGAIGEGMGADGGEGEDLGIWGDDGSAGGEGVGGGAGGGADDEAVAAVSGEGMAIDEDIEFDQSGSGAAADDEVVQGELWGCIIGRVDLGGDEGAFFDGVGAGPDGGQGGGEAVSGQGGEETEAADVDAEEGGG